MILQFYNTITFIMRNDVRSSPCMILRLKKHTPVIWEKALKNIPSLYQSGLALDFPDASFSTQRPIPILWWSSFNAGGAVPGSIEASSWKWCQCIITSTSVTTLLWSRSSNPLHSKSKPCLINIFRNICGCIMKSFMKTTDAIQDLIDN